MPVFDHAKVTVLFVLGGPGAGPSVPLLYSSLTHPVSPPGKGTQCANLVQDFGFCHLSGTFPRVHSLYLAHLLSLFFQ